MKKTISCIVLLSTLVLLLCPILSSCGAEQSTTLYVFNWGEYISDGSEESLNVNEEFEKYCLEELGLNVTVNYSTYSSNEDMYAKISSGAAIYDVIIPSDYMIQRMVTEDMLAPLDISKIPNYENVDDAFKGENVYYENDSDNIYSVPYFYGMVGIIYNSDIVSEEDVASQSWDLMWNENYSRDILQFNNSRDAFGTALYKLGYDVNTATDEQWLEALSTLKSQKDLVQGYVMDEIFNKMKSNSAAVASYYAGDFLSMYEDNDSLAFYYPTEGTNRYVDAMCIPKNSKNYDLATEYINFMCSTEIAIANAEYTYYASPMKTVREDPDYQSCMEEVHPDAMDILYNNAEKVTATPYMNLSPERLSFVNELWEELKVESSIGLGVTILCWVILGTLVVLVTLHTVKKRRRAKYYD